MNENQMILQKIYDIDKRLRTLEKVVYGAKNVNNIPQNQTKVLNSVEDLSKKLDTVVAPMAQKEEKPIINTNTTFKNVPHQSPKEKQINAKNNIKDSKNLEMEVGGKWINRIGIMAIILAIAFFLKYSFDNNLIGPQGRIFIGVIIGVSMLISGDVLFKKYRIPSEGLMGGGIAILSFTIFAAFSFYSLIGQNTAFVLFVIIIVVSAFLAIKNDTVTIMHLGVLTGFLAPFLLFDDFSDVFFLTYLVILNLGAVIISYYRSWKSVFYVAFFATHISYFEWFIVTFILSLFNRGIGQSEFLTPFIPMSIIFIEFLIVSILMNLSPKIERSYLKFDFFLIFMNAIIFYAEGCSMLNVYNDSLLGIFTIIIATVYLAIFYGLRRFQKMEKNFLISLLLVALIFITIAIPVQLDGNFISLAWAIEALVLSYLSNKTEYKKVNITYLIVIGISMISLIFDLVHIGMETTKTPFLNINSLIYVISIIVLFGVLWITREDKNYINIVLTVILNLMLMLFIIIDASNIIDRFLEAARSLEQYEKIENYRYMRNLIQSLIILLYSIVLIIIGFVKNNKSIRLFSLSLFLLVIFKVFLIDLSLLDGVYRILSFVVLGIILLGISFIYQKYKNLIMGENSDEFK